mmetsp:Transcript_96498/g.118258  ORF Transcript_96498/g.118258 Transcript_96498/m.118258 type:complete len:377 (-) Transcript_96498:91-1221(-)
MENVASSTGNNSVDDKNEDEIMKRISKLEEHIIRLSTNIENTKSNKHKIKFDILCLNNLLLFIFVVIAGYAAALSTMNYMENARCQCNNENNIYRESSINNDNICEYIIECTNTTMIPTESPTLHPTIAVPPTIGFNGTQKYNLSTIMSCGTGKYISYTFDDGPAFASNETLIIVDALNKRGIKGTFFVSPAGFAGDIATKCQMVKTLVEMGHEVQSHTWSHRSLTSLSNDEIITEIKQTQDWIYKCSQYKIIPNIFRPPYGELTLEQALIINDLGYTLSFWNLDSFDWKTPHNFSAISSNLISGINTFKNNNSINVLFHDRFSYKIMNSILNLFNDYTSIDQTECFNRCDTLDSYGICRDPNNIYTHYQISLWDL